MRPWRARAWKQKAFATAGAKGRAGTCAWRCASPRTITISKGRIAQRRFHAARSRPTLLCNPLPCRGRVRGSTIASKMRGWKRHRCQPVGYDQPQQQILFNIANKVKHTKIVLLCRQYVPQWDKICRSTGAEVLSPLGLKNLINNRPSTQLAMEVRYLTSVVPKLGGQSRLSSRG
jgi:hypothetical protein